MTAAHFSCNSKIKVFGGILYIVHLLHSEVTTIVALVNMGNSNLMREELEYFVMNFAKISQNK